MGTINFKYTVLLLLLACLLPLHAQQPDGQTPALEFASSSAVRPDKCSVVIIDLNTGEETDSYNKDVPLVPASINKCLTIASTLVKSDIDYRYQTKVYLGGKVDHGVLKGNLVIIGGGDPTLETKQGPADRNFITEIVNALHKKKITSVQGQIIVDSSLFPEPATIPSWQPGDLCHAYGTGCYGFNWQHNAAGKSAVSNPQSKFIRQLTDALSSEGITVTGDTMPLDTRGKAIVNFKSEPISDIMRYCMKESDNLYAEAMLRTLAMLSDRDATPDNGAAIELKYWRKKGCPTDGIVVKDGSGLSRSNRMTSAFLADVLKKMAHDADYVSFFPMAGVEGTVKRFLKDTPLEDYIALKTGSMNGIQCYAGYMLDEDYAPTHAVVIMVNDMPAGRAAVREAVKTMLLKTFVQQ